MSKNYITKWEWEEEHDRKTNRCESCGKYYRMPTFIYPPRDKICFTCESLEKVINEFKMIKPSKALERFNKELFKITK